MAETKYIPMEKRAKGKSSVFKFVTLRNPKKSSKENDDRQLIYHPNTSSSSIIKELDPNSKIPLEDLKKLIEGFEPIISVLEVEKINSDLYNFSDWLFRNRSVIDLESIDNNINADILSEEQLITVWDNLFYFIIKDKEPYIREALLMLIVANNFVIKKKNEELISTDKDLRSLGAANVVIPKVILSSNVSDTSIDNVNGANPKYSLINVDQNNEKLARYRNAIDELIVYNREFLKKLSKVNVKAENTEAITSGDETRVGVSSLSYEAIIKLLDDAPLSIEALTDFVSIETIEVIKELKLGDLNDPIEAIDELKKETTKIQNELFSLKTLNKKQIVAGGSIIELNKTKNATSNFSQGCFPTLIDEVGISSNSALSYIRAQANGFGNSGGASQNKITDFGSISFTLKKLALNSSFSVGLSVENTDANFNKIKYAIMVNNLSLLPTDPIFNAWIYIDGTNTQIAKRVYNDDQIKISRVFTPDGNKIVWQLYRPSTSYLTTLHTTDDQSSSGSLDPLLLDFAFSQRGQAIFNVGIDPCDADTTGGSDNNSETTDEQCSGITNLGVSDYMRVEQDVCCYTAGEVSHIENILKGEYKERSTRRLRRQETTTTFETESTTEKLRDTTTTDRFEMEKESSQVIQQDLALDIGVTASGQYGPVKMTTDIGFATASSSVEANLQASNYAKEVSSRALDRVVNRVREERVNKVVEEFEENNLHGLDNTNNADGHVTGLYRWVDKIYKNQVVNYGKRLSFEFMIPEPAKFHL